MHSYDVCFRPKSLKKSAVEIWEDGHGLKKIEILTISWRWGWTLQGSIHLHESWRPSNLGPHTYGMGEGERPTWGIITLFFWNLSSLYLSFPFSLCLCPPPFFFCLFLSKSYPSPPLPCPLLTFWFPPLSIVLFFPPPAPPWLNQHQSWANEYVLLLIHVFVFQAPNSFENCVRRILFLSLSESITREEPVWSISQYTLSLQDDPFHSLRNLWSSSPVSGSVLTAQSQRGSWPSGAVPFSLAKMLNWVVPSVKSQGAPLVMHFPEPSYHKRCRISILLSHL